MGEIKIWNCHPLKPFQCPIENIWRKNQRSRFRKTPLWAFGGQNGFWAVFRPFRLLFTDVTLIFFPTTGPPFVNFKRCSQTFPNPHWTKVFVFHFIWTFLQKRQIYFVNERSLPIAIAHISHHRHVGGSVLFSSHRIFSSENAKGTAFSKVY